MSLPPLVAEVVAQYDDEGLLAPAVARRLEALRADSGKVCAACQVKRPLSAFGRDASTASGLRTYCRECLSQRNRLS